MIHQKLLDLVAASSVAPPLFEPGEPTFWDDPHVSSSMLQAHLDSPNDIASVRSCLFPNGWHFRPTFRFRMGESSIHAPLASFNDSFHLSQRISFDHSFGEASRTPSPPMFL
jgi:hypothetical protein